MRLSQLTTAKARARRGAPAQRLGEENPTDTCRCARVIEIVPDIGMRQVQ